MLLTWAMRCILIQSEVVNVSAGMGALIGSIVGAVLSAVVAVYTANKQHDKTIALVEYRLKELEDKVDKHNNVIERLYIAEGKIDLLMRKGA